jgi:carboxylate-amine ligase
MGVEEEFLLVDGEGRLSREGPAVAEAAEESVDGELETELKRCQVEAVSAICHTPDEVVAQLTGLRAELARTAARRGLRLLPSACPIVPETGLPEITPSLRYLRMARRFGATTRSVATCGCHVHVGIPDRATGIEISNHVRPWLPVLLALTANSPFDGTDTGYASWRYQEWSRWPSSGPPPLFASLDEYESIVDAMLRAGALLDRGMIYWDIRLSERHPTVEFRVSDVAVTPRHAGLLATLIRGLAAAALEAVGTAPPDLSLPVLRANLWRASRDGLDGAAPHPVTGHPVPMQSQLDDLVDRLTPVLDVDLEFVKAEVAHLREHGTGAARQRRVFQRRKEFTDVVDALVVSPEVSP